VDLSILSAATDVVLGLGDPLERVIDFNFQASRDADLSRRVLVYNALLHQRFRVPVHSVVVLLRPAADERALTGHYRYEGYPHRSQLAFTFDVVRLWRRPVREFLSAGPGALPLAVLAEMPGGASVKRALPNILKEIDERLTHQSQPFPAGDLWTAAFVLSGLRLPRGEAVELFKGILVMKESTTYQWIIEQGMKEGMKEGVKEGALKEARNMILMVGDAHLGKPSAAVKKLINEISDLERLHRMSKRLLKVETWQELLESP
jgi:predicted transposase YdaD